MSYAATIAKWLSLGASDVVLDLGSGCGFMGRAIAPKVKQLHCADISAKFLAFCADELGEFDNVSTHLITYADLSPLPEGGITKAYSSAVFIHFNFYDIVVHLNALNRVLARGATLFFDFLDPSGIEDGAGWLFRRHMSYYFYDRGEIATLVQYNSSEAVRTAAQMTGFRCERIWQMNGEAFAAILRKSEESDAFKLLPKSELDY
jgi:ubiquinone/menaquinone biosynthesis C-methylase UbiE